MEQAACVCAIIVAAGSSSRMGGKIPKQLMELCGKPLLSYTLQAFESSVRINHVVLVCREEDTGEIQKIAAEFPKVTKIVPGGKTRQQSVKAGVLAAGEAELIAIHDGARPLVTPEEIDRVVEDCEHWGASSLAIPAVDTIKEVDSQEQVTATPERSRLRAVQTPQVFWRKEYLDAMEKAERDGKDFTDDCQLMEYVGRIVHLCMGSRRNSKITTPEDLVLAESFLREEKEHRKGGSMRIGHGYDVHRLVTGRKLIIGGVEIPWEKGLLGHSDADVLSHAVCDALLGAAALGDIGKLFPDTDPAYCGADSLKLLQEVCRVVRQKGYEIGNLDATILAQAPKFRPHIEKMRENLAAACGISPDQVSVKATTEEGLGFTGAGEGIAAHCVCLLL